MLFLYRPAINRNCIGGYLFRIRSDTINSFVPIVFVTDRFVLLRRVWQGSPGDTSRVRKDSCLYLHQAIRIHKDLVNEISMMIWAIHACDKLKRFYGSKTGSRAMNLDGAMNQ